MGTEITLEVGGLTLDWSKNSRGNDHGALFQEKDRKRVRSDQINYEYFADNDEEPDSMEMAFSRPLKEVVPRLELLGFTLDRARIEYARCVKSWIDERQSIADDESDTLPDAMNFDEFCAFVTSHSIRSLDSTFDSSFDDKHAERVRGRFSDTSVTGRIPRPSFYEATAYSELSYFADLINILDPYTVLRMLAENAENLEADVVWQYGPLVDNGWASETEFKPHARRTQTFLIATEGTSDVHILSRAFELLKPEVADFFKFIDASKSHPFSGAGNLLKFADGLAMIDVHNQVVFLFDNDAEGYEAHLKLSRFALPSNMRAITLPQLVQLSAFPAQGPDGVSSADINRRAAAIECYLDLELNGRPPARVLWSNYKKELDTFQGALEYKETYTKAFLEQTSKTLLDGSYDTSKLHAVLDALFFECSSIATDVWKSAD